MCVERLFKFEKQSPVEHWTLFFNKIEGDRIVENIIHLVIVWPIAINHMKLIQNHLCQIDANILYGIHIYPNPADLKQFITDIYSESQYDLQRIEEKKTGIINYLSHQGIIAITFSIEKGKQEWNIERNRFVFPAILNLKKSIRDDIQDKEGTISVYETIHMTDDSGEFENDLSALMKLICISKCKYYKKQEIFNAII